MLVKSIFAVLLIALAGCGAAHAKKYDVRVQEFCQERYGPCAGLSAPIQMRQDRGPRFKRTHIAKRSADKPRRVALRSVERSEVRAQPAAAAYTAVFESGGAPQVVNHPAGCPRVAFCGCGTSLFLLGKAVAQGGLAIAANWLGFPAAEPAPGMAAARRGHVFAIVKVIKPGVVLAYDPNSGRHQTRLHVRSLRGYRVVNPHGSNRYASAS